MSEVIADFYIKHFMKNPNYDTSILNKQRRLRSFAAKMDSFIANPFKKIK